jgi:RNA polymerase sigma-70 factor (ECF subfamily)
LSEKEFLTQLQEHQHIIYKLAHLYASSPEDKKDLYQEIVLQAWKGFASFRREAKFSTWLYRLCLNTIFTIQRKVSKVEYTDTAKYADLYVVSSGDEEAERLYQAIRQLPQTDRAIVSMHLDGYDNLEIAITLGMTPNHIGVRLHRARQQLAKLLSSN